MIRLVVVAVLAVTLCGSPHAAENSEFAASKGASAEEMLRERLLAALRWIPGTTTQYLIGGWVQLDAIAAHREQDHDEQDTFLVSKTLFEAADPKYRLGIRQTSLNWVSRAPTTVGPIWTRLEANLFPIDGTTAPTLQQLFVRWDEHLVLGKTYSTFMDDEALPVTLDYNGPTGVIFARQWLARGSVGLGECWTLDASIEEPDADASSALAGVDFETTADRPDLVGRVRYEGERGHVQLAVISRHLSLRATGPSGTNESAIDGAGVAISGSLALFEDDALMFHAATGEAVARYFNDPLTETGLGLEAGGPPALIRTSGATLYYHRAWTPDWSSDAGGSASWIGDDEFRAPDSLRRAVYVSANLVHLVTPSLVLGAEGLWGKATRVDGDHATNYRLQISARYLVF